MNDAIQYLIDRIMILKDDRPLIVAIDGVDASGKTTLADNMAEIIAKTSNLNPIRISIDKFHNSAEIRMSQGTGIYRFSLKLTLMKSLNGR